MTSTADVIVVGAGSVGVPTALALAQDGMDVLVIDRLASPGQGSNKSAIGGVRATHSDPAKVRLCRRSLEVFKGWEAVHGQDIEWTTGGYVFVAYRPQEAQTFQALLQTQKALGLNIDWHDGEGVLRIVPDLNPRGLLGGTFSPEDGHCSTLLASHALAQAAQARGVRFHFRECVKAVLTAGGRVTGVQTDQGSYSAPTVINAAGAWADELGAALGVQHPILPESHEAGITEPVQPFLGPMIVDIRPAPGSTNYYFYQLCTGQVVFCLTPAPAIPGTDLRETSEFLPMVARRMVDLMPRLAPLRVRRVWRGLYPMTPDGSPLVGWCGAASGYLIAIGMCGQGFMLGPGLGELLARMVRAGPDGVPSLSADDQEILRILSPTRRFVGHEALK